MSFNGTGTFVINSSGQPVVSGTVASATVFNAFAADLATGLSTCITKDGQTTPTNNIPMGGFKITGLGAGTVGGDAVRLSQLQAGTAQLLTVSGTDTLTALGTPAVTAYTTGNLFYFVAAATNTTSVTLNVDGLGARNMTRHGSVALVAGDILSGEVCVVVYDGTRFQLLNPGSYTNLNVSGVLSLAAGTALLPSLAFTGDPNTGMWSPAADTIAFSEGGVEAMRLDSSGNLGIGTSSPVAKLSVQDASVPKFALQVGSAERAFLSYTESNFTTRLDSDGPLVFAANNAEVGRFNVSGNLGIGTSSPSVKFVVSNAGANGFEFDPTTGVAQTYNRSGAAYTGYKIYGLDLEFRAGASPAVAMTIDSNRNIVAGASAALLTTATNGFLYVPTCAGTPTGTPTAITGMAPIVVNTTNNKLYFYSSGVWRDAGP